MGCLCPGPQPAFTEGLRGLTEGVAVSKGGSSLEVKGEGSDHVREELRASTSQTVWPAITKAWQEGMEPV